jgi:hypothetical protein
MSLTPYKHVLHKLWSHINGCTEMKKNCSLPGRYLWLPSTVGSKPDREMHARGVSNYGPSPPSSATIKCLLQRLCGSLKVTDPGTCTLYTQGLNSLRQSKYRDRQTSRFTPHVLTNEDYCPEFTSSSQELSIRPTPDITLDWSGFPIFCYTSRDTWCTSQFTDASHNLSIRLAMYIRIRLDKLCSFFFFRKAYDMSPLQYIFYNSTIPNRKHTLSPHKFEFIYSDFPACRMYFTMGQNLTGTQHPSHPIHYNAAALMVCLIFF